MELPAREDGFMMLEELEDSTRWYVNNVPEEMLDQIGMAKIVSTGIPTGMTNASSGIDGFMMLEDLDDTSRWYVNGVPEEILMENDQISLTKVVNTGTQTGITNAPPGSRKIKPVKHPGLKLQTPIAYQRDTDLNVIPIHKEGRAVCKKCGAIGVKHAFYTRERRYCSLACARGAAEEGIEVNDDISEETECSEPSPDKMVIYTQPPILESQLPPVFIFQQDEPIPVPESVFSFDWSPHLCDPYFIAAPVSCFPHAPMSDIRNYIDVGLKVEVENKDSHDLGDDLPHSSSIATVLRVEGYKALLRYEGYGEDGSKDFWVNVCSPSIHPVGWCAIRGKPLIPPHEIKHKYSNWKEYLRKRLTGARTLPSNFNSKVQDSLKSRFRCDLTVEVVDKNRVSQVKVAKIMQIIGKRLKLRYYDTKSHLNDAEFWCHEDSPLIHPVGWAKSVGQKLNAPPEYHDRVSKGLREKDDATPDLFALPERLFPNCCFFQEGMKLEAIDPLNLSDVCVATVMQVLNDGYLMISVDFWNDQHPTSEDWFCYHMTSPCIFPAGFCASNNIPLTPPKDYNKDSFDWNRYLLETGCMAAPPTLFNHEIPDHGFNVGMKLEAADLMNPRLVCVATIGKVVGRLLKLQFDGWGSDYDQWVDCLSCDLYPVGWCELVQHKLEPPFSETKPMMEPNKVAESPSPSIKIEQMNNGIEENPKFIPRLSDVKMRNSPTVISPEIWDVSDVAEFLKVNDCSQYRDAFVKQGINGKKLIQLTKEEVHSLVAKKVGPALKIQNLIDQLKSKMNPPTHSPRLR